jgi:hypothetical protein
VSVLTWSAFILASWLRTPIRSLTAVLHDALYHK